MEPRGIARIPKKELATLRGQAKLLCQAIQARRKELGFTQESFAEKIDMSVTTLKFIEQGRRLPSLLILLRLAKALKLKLEFLPNQS